MPGLFASDAVIRRVDREGVILLGGGRALLLQLAHPQVAQGVDEHSNFAREPLKRLRGTLEATYALVFGDAEMADRTARQVRSIHGRVRGPGYDATDPALLCWVHATLIDTALRVYTATVGPLSPADEDEYYEQSIMVAELFGCPRAHQPSDIHEFRDYLESMVDSLQVTDTARRLANTVVHPDPLWAQGPPFAMARFVTIGMLPEPLRQQYGLRWDERHARALRFGATATRRVMPHVPRFVRQAPAAYFTRRGASQLRHAA